MYPVYEDYYDVPKKLDMVCIGGVLTTNLTNTNSFPGYYLVSLGLSNEPSANQNLLNLIFLKTIQLTIITTGVTSLMDALCSLQAISNAGIFIVSCYI